MNDPYFPAFSGDDLGFGEVLPEPIEEDDPEDFSAQWAEFAF